MSADDAFAVVREHRWISADDQAEMLRATKPKAVWSLDGGTKLAKCRLIDLDKWSAAPGRVFRVVHLFLLVEPARNTPVMREGLKTLVHNLVDKRGAVIEELDSGLSTAHPGQRRTMVLAAREMIRASCQGAKSALNGRRMRGRQLVEFTREQFAQAKTIWRDTVEYPHEDNDAAPALAKIRARAGEPFTKYRARALWKSRKSKR